MVWREPPQNTNETEQSPAMNDSQRTMRSIIQRIATGPELSKDISVEEARIGMQAILDAEVDPVQAGIFMIALRMKRETDDEQRGVLDAVRDATRACGRRCRRGGRHRRPL
jgi:anthranilate phosphoribosyltransferase